MTKREIDLLNLFIDLYIFDSALDHTNGNTREDGTVDEGDVMSYRYRKDIVNELYKEIPLKRLNRLRQDIYYRERTKKVKGIKLDFGENRFVKEEDYNKDVERFIIEAIEKIFTSVSFAISPSSMESESILFNKFILRMLDLDIYLNVLKNIGVGQYVNYPKCFLKHVQNSSECDVCAFEFECIKKINEIRAESEKKIERN